MHAPRVLAHPARITALALLSGACQSAGLSPKSLDSPQPATTAATAPSAHRPRILFVGNSLTHGRYQPVRGFGASAAVQPARADIVIDENFGAVGARAEHERGPWGGIPGIFARLASDAGHPYEVHIEAISATSLTRNFAAASAIIARPDWDAIVLQELSTVPLPEALAAGKISAPTSFCKAVDAIEAAVHAVAPAARVYLYQTYPSAEVAAELSGSQSDAGFAPAYQANLAKLAVAYHDVFAKAFVRNGHIAAIAPVGDAWMSAMHADLATFNPYEKSALPTLWYGINPTNDPPIAKADGLHPSVFGAYLAAVVLYEVITGTEVSASNGTEPAARELGIANDLAAKLRSVAAQTVGDKTSTLINPDADPCSP